MASGILGIALTGLNAAQAGIRVTEHNIANANTAGYRRQEVSYAAQAPLYTRTGYFGNGVGVDTVRSLYSQFLDNELLLDQAQVARHETYGSGATRIDGMLGDAGSGLSGAIDSFFNAINELANDPTSGAARQVILSAGNNLAGRFNTLDTQLRADLASINGEIGSAVGQINLYASQIATLNGEIARAEAASGGQPANDLRDQRQQLISELNKLVNISLVQQGDGADSVYIGSGQPLVVGNQAYTLGSRLDPDNSLLRLPTVDVGGATLTLGSDLISGGKLGGLLALREEVLLPAYDDVNRLALGIASEVNRVHRGGLDAALAAGGDFFANPVVPQGSTVNALQMTLTNDTLLDPRGYTLAQTGAGLVVTALSSGTSTTYADLAAFNAAGLGFTLSGTPAAGDSWQIGDYARQMRMVLGSATQVAAAGSTADGPGDNTNALALAGLRFKAVLDGGSASFGETYGQTLSRTASRASEADLNLSAFTSLASSAEAASRSVSGVNLDEEAVNLIRFQQAYQAVAKAIQVASSLFEEVLGIVR